LRVSLNTRGVFAGEYNIPSQEEVQLAILADVNRVKRKDGLNHSSQYRRERWAVEDPYSPMYWTHGISYQVDPAGKSTFRTVHIGNISNGVSLEQVLEYVRGGKIVSAVLLDTTITNNAMSVLVIFIQASDAAAYVAFVREHPIKICGKKLEVTLVCSATYPMNRTLVNAIVRHQTRCVRVRNYPANGVPVSSLKHDLRLWGPLDIPSTSHMFIDDNGTLQIRCSSIVAANRIFGLWLSHPVYRALGIEFGPDPCAGSFDELLKQRPALDCENPGLTNYLSGESSSKQYTIPEIPPRPIPCSNLDEIDLSDGSVDGYVPPTRLSTPETIQIYMRPEDMAPSITTAKASVMLRNLSMGSRASRPGERIGLAESGFSAFQTYVLEGLGLSDRVYKPQKRTKGLAGSIYATSVANSAGLGLIQDIGSEECLSGEVVVNTKNDTSTEVVFQPEVKTISHKEFAAGTKIDVNTEDTVQAEIDAITSKESAVEVKTDVNRTATVQAKVGNVIKEFVSKFEVVNGTRVHTDNTANTASDAATETFTNVETAGGVES
jgi:hypothetical protein